MHKSTPESRIRLRYHLVLVVVACVGLAATGAYAQTGTLQGTVTDVASGEPIGGAFIVALGGLGGGIAVGGFGPRHAMSLEDGGYVIEELPAGHYVVKCGARGHLISVAEATISDGETTVLDFALEPRVYGSVTGLVTEATSGQPIAGAHVMLIPSWLGGFDASGALDERLGLGLHAVTGEDGSYLMEHVPVGDYEARAASFGYFPSAGYPLTVVDGETTQVDIELDPLAFGSVEGVVADALTGDPIAGAMVRVFPTVPMGEGPGHGGGMHQTFTDQNGLYRFDELAVGVVRVVTQAAGYAPADGQAEIIADQTVVFDVELEPMAFGRLEGYVTDAQSGEPLVGAFVVVVCDLPDGGRPDGGWVFAVTDENGFYHLDKVAAGHCLVRALSWGYSPGEEEAEIVADEVTIVDFALAPIGGDSSAHR